MDASPFRSLLRHRRVQVGATILLVLVPLVVVWMISSGTDPFSAPPSTPPIPPIGETGRFAAMAHATPIGRTACTSCHPEQGDHHARSSHASALARIDLDREPPDTTFHHRASGRDYRVYRQGDTLRHRESLQRPDREALVLSDHPLKYVVGSGHQGRTYLVELDGFLVQSPITWYTSRQAWDLAPGYNHGDHAAFERPIPVDCLVCHAGRSESIGGAYHRVAVQEQTIDCERCHGPGSRHEAWHESAEDPDSEHDANIVHPGLLSRERSESICAQCHLQNNAAANIRGRRLTGFQPGQKLAEHRAYFVLESPDPSMTVVGHVGQLHQSRCYTQTKTLTCTTCHDPHRTIPKAEARAWYRNKCLDCHQADGCGLPVTDAGRRNNSDDCATCHMPRTSTEIPHVASTHHRIGIHPAESPKVTSPGGTRLVPLYDLSHLPPLDLDRCRGLAYRQLASKQTDSRSVAGFRRLGLESLEAAFAGGLRDAELLAALADLLQQSDRARAAQLSRSALALDESLPPQDRVNALAILSGTLLVRGRNAEAIPILERLVTLHRSAEAWLQLGQCRAATGDPAGALAAAEKAVQIGPQRASIHSLLADLYQQAGRADDARAHRETSRALRQATRQDR